LDFSPFSSIFHADTAKKAQKQSRSLF